MRSRGKPPFVSGALLQFLPDLHQDPAQMGFSLPDAGIHSPAFVASVIALHQDLIPCGKQFIDPVP